MKIKKASGNHLVFVIPDTHFPNENKQAVAVTKRALARLKPSRTVVLGDMLDCGTFSPHIAKSLKELRQSNFLEEEIRPANEFLDFIQKHTKDETAFIEGNHENFCERWAITHGEGAKSVYDAISPKYQLSKGRSDWKWVPYIKKADPGFSYYEITKNLVAVHGWSFAKNAASVHLDRAKGHSVVFGHTHRQQSDASRNPFTKERSVSFSVGCLSELQPTYMHSPNDWIHGFGLIYISKSNPREFTEYSLTINNGRVILPDGSEINGD